MDRASRNEHHVTGIGPKRPQQVFYFGLIRNRCKLLGGDTRSHATDDARIRPGVEDDPGLRLAPVAFDPGLLIIGVHLYGQGLAGIDVLQE